MTKLASPFSQKKYLVISLMAGAFALLGFTEGDRFLELTGSFNARSEAKFAGRDNIIGHLPAGTKAEILEHFKFKSGNYGLRVRPQNGSKAGQEVWIYFNQKRQAQTPMTFYRDSSGNQTPARPDQAPAGQASANPESAVARESQTVVNLEPANQAPTDPTASAVAPLAAARAVMTRAVTPVRRPPERQEPEAVAACEKCFEVPQSTTSPLPLPIPHVDPPPTAVATRPAPVVAARASANPETARPATPPTSAASPAGCFSGARNPLIAKYLKVGPEFNDTPESIRQIHELIHAHRDLIDPRLVYYRMLGESGADPEATHRHSKAYGMFQFNFGPRGKVGPTYRQILENLYQQNPGKSRRLIQTEYYLKNYVPRFIAAAKAGYGCNRSKPWEQYTRIDRSAYFGWGNCSPGQLAEERALCSTPKKYNADACAIAKDYIHNENYSVPICQ